nr:hypothetical protein [Gluconobacter japonicus]
MLEHPRDAVAVDVRPPVCFLWNAAALARWNDRQDPVDHQILTETIAVITPIGQHGLWVGNRQHRQGACGSVVRAVTSGKDKAKRTFLIVALGVNLARKAAA